MAFDFSVNAVYISKKDVIAECLSQFNDFTNAINEVCNHAALFGQSLKTLEDLTVPEIIGREQMKNVPSGKFNSAAHLMDSLDYFRKIMLLFSTKIQAQAIDNFDNFIMQAVLPSSNEIQGFLEHNRKIVVQFRELFFSLYNHLMILAAELMETFLLCDECSSPIGFPHQSLCLIKSMSTNSMWKKTKFDDKFITHGMNLCFNDIIKLGSLKNIRSLIIKTCLTQRQCQGHEKPSMPLTTKSWPSRWKRDEKNKKPILMPTVSADKQSTSLLATTIWTPQISDLYLLPENRCIASFSYQPK